MKFKVPKPQLKIPKVDLKKSAGVLGENYRKVADNTKTRLHVEKISAKEKILSAISYLFIVGLVERIFTKKRSDYLNYHQRQSVALLVFLAFFLLIPEYGFTLFGPIVVILMLINLIVAMFGGTVKLIPK